MTTRIYVDGIFDLFHRGHLESIKKCRSLSDNVFLMVGVISDSDATSYKRKPIYSEEDRCCIISSIKGVDELIFPAPLIVTNEFLQKHNIDLIVHGFSSPEDEKKQEGFYRDIKDKFKVIPYYDGQSTSSIIRYIKNSDL
ncbi:MAG: adenylyltransferase/cytidyltransferase family protein [Candidatus Colwellbacteria bacterium]|nr:adenylyltransferase/cytidyltransferase family protein [Candidatus Colwellbacteria bacterium]